MLELSAGQIVADKYRIDGVMGTGGMGVIVAATHVELDQRVAIKFLREVSPEALARFQREARLLVRLKSPHVAKVFDVGSLEDDTPYIVMEHLDGSDLSTVLGARGRLPHEEAIDYVLQASEAVAEAHALGMVHRDLKPANIFLAKGPGTTTTVKVLDFGVSKILDDRVDAGDQTRGGDLTNEGVALGSPGYMSPEQMTSARNVDARSDIFSLGALLYRLIAGHTPYKGNSIVTLLAAMATEKVVPLHRIAPDVPEGVSLAVERCLAQERDQRWQNVALFAQALLPYASRRGRVMIEQISGTLGLAIPEDVLSATLQRPLSAPPAGFAAQQRPASIPPSGVPFETLIMSPGPGPVRSSMPPPTFGPMGSQRTLALSVALLALGFAMAIAGWRIARSTASDDSRTTTAHAPASTATAAAQPIVTAATVVTAATPAPPIPTQSVAPNETAGSEPPRPGGGRPTPIVKPRSTSGPRR